MKLETKFQDENFDFGEIVKAKVTTYYDENKVVVMADRARGGVSRFEYNSIKGFTDNWEDALEEPKGKALYWMILTLENFIENEPDDKWVDLEDCKRMLEKLKAWERLKDLGFKCSYHSSGYHRGTFTADFIFDEDKLPIMDTFVVKDLNLLFGGNE